MCGRGRARGSRWRPQSGKGRRVGRAGGHDVRWVVLLAIHPMFLRYHPPSSQRTLGSSSWARALTRVPMRVSMHHDIACRVDSWGSCLKGGIPAFAGMTAGGVCPPRSPGKRSAPGASVRVRARRVGRAEGETRRRDIARTTHDGFCFALLIRRCWICSHVQVKSFRPLRVRVPFVLSKGTKTAGSIGRRSGFAAPVPCAPRSWRHGAQTRCAQTRAPLRPPRPAVLGGLKVAKIKIKFKFKFNGNGNGNGNGLVAWVEPSATTRGGLCYSRSILRSYDTTHRPPSVRWEDSVGAGRRLPGSDVRPSCLRQEHPRLRRCRPGPEGRSRVSPGPSKWREVASFRSGSRSSARRQSR